MSAKARNIYVALLPELRQWWEAGLIYRQIAALLNGSGHSTRSGVSWNYTQVKRTLARVRVWLS